MPRGNTVNGTADARKAYTARIDSLNRTTAHFTAHPGDATHSRNRPAPCALMIWC